MAPVAKVSPSLTASSSPRGTTTTTSSSSKSTTAAADIIKSIDAAFSVASTSTINAAQEVEDARRNARAASEVARRFLQMASSSTTRTTTATTNNSPRGGGLLLSDYCVNGSGHKSPHTSSYGSAGSSPRARGGLWNSATSIRKRKGGSPRATGTSGAGGTSQAHQKNVEDLVSLSLEIDRAKQDLESERMMHDETRSELAQSKSKNGQLGHQIERLLNDMETQREASGRKIDSYEREVAHYRLRMHAAEEDAEAALDIANENSNNREQVEEVLTQALQQIQDLKEQLSCKNALLAQVQHTASVSAAAIPPPPPPPPPQSTLPHPSTSAIKDDSKHSPSSPTTKVVRFAESPTILASPPPPATAVAGPHTGGDITSSSQTTDAAVMTPQRRSLVASGRELLYRSLGSPSPMSSIDSSNVSFSPPTTAAGRAFESMSERRQQLKNRLKSLHVDLALPSTPSSPPPASSSSSSSVAVTTAHVKAPHTPATSPKGGAAVPATAGTPIPGSDLERVAKDVSDMLRASGRRLSLTGRWWTDEEGDMEPCGDSGDKTNGNIDRAVFNSSAHLETLARHYCTSVEVLVDRKRQEVIELESLCALWEQGNTAEEMYKA